MQQPSALGEPWKQTLAQKLLKRRVVLREIDQKCLKRRRVRHRRLRVYSTDPKRPQGDLWATIDRIPPTRPSWQDRPYRELKKKKIQPPDVAVLVSLNQ